MRIDPAKVSGLAFTINLVTPDNGERFVVELSNDTLTNLQGFTADDPDLTITADRTDLEEAMIGTRPLQQQIADGTVALDGDAALLGTLATLLVHFRPDFEIMPGTAGGAGSPLTDPFVQEPLGDSSGG
ncbi:alkyl sulfatase C-terminal domain-containing protein [Pseudonocardia sp.]|uniref:alkyl sulfatase C-terminal domain-containing protein n=1 Tax=Pseudonocardia sp. TaxID=60912 RepID=UPI0026087AA8|nr:alkyl sulfatase C-terminal domain-containing protein [Pseudonocardia sp.]